MKLFKKIKSKRVKGYSLLEIMAYTAIILIFAYGGINVVVSTVEKAKVSVLRSDFAMLDSTILQMMYEYAGLGEDHIDSNDFDILFNQYVDSSHNLKSWDGSSGNMAKKDPWNAQYKVTFTQKSGSESTILIESWGKKFDQPNFALLVHYKDGELRSGTAGFMNDSGRETSDAQVDENGKATITSLWAETATTP